VALLLERMGDALGEKIRRYRVMYHVGSDVTIKTKANSGKLTVGEDGISISGGADLRVPFSSMVRVEMFRMHGMARMIKLVCRDRTVFLAVVRFMILGYFASVNFFRTGELYETLKRKVPKTA
jgi:hypothetical protein